MPNHQLLEQEQQGALDFFRDFTNLDPHSPGFGLTVDVTRKPQIASIASVGFALSAWVIAVERGHTERADAVGIVRRTLTTLLQRVEHRFGFFAHFVDMQSGARWRTCEFSTIDTALCLNGVITAAAYFRDADIEALAQQLLERVDWRAFVVERDGRTLFRMAYNPDAGGDYVGDNPGFVGHWDMAAEQKMLYLQAAPVLEPELARALYRGFDRAVGDYEGQPVIINPGGTLFAYQYTEAWLDAARYLDPDGVDWFENTRLAAFANRAFCLAHAGEFRSYHEHCWGIGCGDTPWGYDVSGAPPALVPLRPNGVVSISNATACLPFIPDLTLDMLAHLRRAHPQTWGPYGFYDAFTLDAAPPWYSQAVYGINKGCALLMIENYLSGLIWDVYTHSPWIQRALAILGFTTNDYTTTKLSTI